MCRIFEIDKTGDHIPILHPPISLHSSFQLSGANF